MWYTKSLGEVKRDLRTNFDYGLTEEEVTRRQEISGPNRLKEKKKESFFIKFIKQFNDFMIIILIIASIISALVSYFEGSGDYFDSIIIIAIVIFNSLMGVIQEAKAEKSIEALQKMTAPTAKVRRSGKIQEIDAIELVPGDIIILESGNFVPADCRLIKSFNLKIEEASLTGENVPATKDANVVLKNECNLGDMVNMAFSSCIVTSGNAEGVVTDIGMNTKVGKIAKMIIEDKAPETPIQKKLAGVGKTLGIACLVICVFIFVIGLFKKISPLEMFMTSVGLAVAAIPEGLPAIVTIMLSIGVTKMARKNAIIRKLPAVETLGSSGVICSDKTGTLTQNKMKVIEISDFENTLKIDTNREKSEIILKLASMCTTANIEMEENKLQAVGEPTEVAIVNAALSLGINKNDINGIEPKVNELPFDSTRKMMSTIHKLKNGKYRVITKGAPDVLLNKCINYLNGEELNTLNSFIINKILDNNRKMAKKALRVIAVAYKDINAMPSKITSEELEIDLNFVGLVGMIDPPREGVKEAIRTCKRAGIKTVMITGDHIDTAKAIARDLGILSKSDLSITGKELDKIGDDNLKRNIMKYSVFARVSPEHKVRIVKAYQSTGAVVAMTGDGVNDSPALKNADIGIAMGKNGTDVAKNAADMILADDNFVTIVEAVKQGRNIYDNIRKAIHFLIATNIGEIVTIFVGLILGMKSPLLAIQLLWINLVTDSLPAIALGLEKPEKDIMNRFPKDAKKGLFSDGLWGEIFSEGVMIGILTLLAFSIGNKLGGIVVGRTMAFVSLGILELVHSFNIKSKDSIFKVGLFENKYLIGAFVLGTLLQIGVLFIPSVANIFKLTMLNGMQWLITVAISISPIIIVEAQKKLNKEKETKEIFKESKVITNEI